MDNINYDNLNNMVQYIEEHLQEAITMKKLARIVGISENSLQRIFHFIAGISLTEYIKNRRLSKAFEEIRETNTKIMNIALKYQYNSNISFSRSFKKLFGITPMECRNRSIPYQQFPIITFKPQFYEVLNFEVKDLEQQEIYCYEVKAEKQEDLLYKIRELYQSLKEKGIHQKLKKEKQYAISYYKNGVNYYAVGSKTQYTSKTKKKIPAGKYAIFEVGTREQKDIVKAEEKVYTQWLKSTNINVDEDYTIEYYIGENCYLCIPIVA